MQQKILLPIAFVISFFVLTYAVFMVIRSRSITPTIRTDMTTQVNPETEQLKEETETVVSGIPTAAPTMKNEISLAITTPVNGMTVSQPTVTVQGTTVPSADVYVNDVYGTANSAGKFSITTSLDEGENSIVIVVNDADGNTAEKELTVTYTAPEE